MRLSILGFRVFALALLVGGAVYVSVDSQLDETRLRGQAGGDHYDIGVRFVGAGPHNLELCFGNGVTTAAVEAELFNLGPLDGSDRDGFSVENGLPQFMSYTCAAGFPCQEGGGGLPIGGAPALAAGDTDPLSLTFTLEDASQCDNPDPRFIGFFSLDIFPITHGDPDGSNERAEVRFTCGATCTPECSDGIFSNTEACDGSDSHCIGNPSTSGVPWNTCEDAVIFGAEVQDAWIAFMEELITNPPDNVCEEECDDFQNRFFDVFGRGRGPCECSACDCRGNPIVLSCGDVSFPDDWCSDGSASSSIIASSPASSPESSPPPSSVSSPISSPVSSPISSPASSPENSSIANSSAASSPVVSSSPASSDPSSRSSDPVSSPANSSELSTQNSVSSGCSGNDQCDTGCCENNVCIALNCDFEDTQDGCECVPAPFCCTEINCLPASLEGCSLSDDNYYPNLDACLAGCGASSASSAEPELGICCIDDACTIDVCTHPYGSPQECQIDCGIDVCGDKIRGRLPAQECTETSSLLSPVTFL